MSYLRKFAFVLVVLALVGAVLAQQVTVTLWMHDHPPRVPLDKTLIQEFMDQNPDIKVDYRVISVANFDTTLYTALASGQGPDLFNQATFALGQFKAAGVIQPLDPVAAGFGSIQGFEDAYSTGTAGAMFDGVPYGIPTENSIFTCFTNDQAWKAAGLDPQTDFPETWEQMVSVAEKLTTRDSQGNPTQRGFDFNWTSPIFVWLQFNPMVTQLGGMIIDEKTFTSHLDSPEVAKVMQYWVDWANKYKLGGPQYTGSRDAFLAGDLATDCSFGNWGVPQMVDAGIEYSIHPVPRWADAVNDNGFDQYGYYLLVNSRSRPDVQAAAWKLAGFLTSEPQQYFETAGLFQPKKSFVDSAAFKDNTIMPVFLSEMAKSNFSPRIPGFNEVADQMARARDQALAGGSIDAVLKQVNVQVQSTLERARKEAERGQ